MAKGSYYRKIMTIFWQDAKVSEQMNIHERYLFLYFLTNPHTNLSGLYEITIKQIADETGFSRKDVALLMNKLEELKVIKYDGKTNELFIINWSRYNWNKSNKILKGVENELGYVKSNNLLDSLLKYTTDTDYLIQDDGMGKISISYRYSIPRIEKENTEGETEERKRTEMTIYELSNLNGSDLNTMSLMIGLDINQTSKLYDQLKQKEFVSENGEVIQTKEDFINYLKAKKESTYV